MVTIETYNNRPNLRDFAKFDGYRKGEENLFYYLVFYYFVTNEYNYSLYIVILYIVTK